MDPDGKVKYQAVFLCFQDEIVPFVKNDYDEMDRITLWDLKQDIGYVDECDLEMVKLSCCFLWQSGQQIRIKSPCKRAVNILW